MGSSPGTPRGPPVSDRAAPSPSPAYGGAPTAPQPSQVSRLASTVERLRREAADAQEASDGRALIEMAKGILVERLGCGPAEANRQLTELADRSTSTVLALAVDIINQAARDQVSEIAQQFLEAVDTEPPAARSLTPAVRLRAAESRVLAATDSQAVATALLENALSPLGANGVAVWAVAADSSIALVGQAGFTPEEAVRWRYVPPEVATCARLAMNNRDLTVVNSLSDAGVPTIGRRRYPDGGRIMVPAGTGGRLLGVLEVSWPEPLPAQPPRVLRQLEALAELCSHTLEAGAPGPDPASDAPHLAAVAELTDLADHLHDPVLVLTPHLDPSGRLTDFRIRHGNQRFVDPAGRPHSMVTGTLFLESYPTAAEDHGLFSKLERVYATGEPCQASRTTLTALVDEVPLTSTADVGISRHGTSLLLVWRIEDETARLASLLQHAQRLGRVGGFEQNITTGATSWNDQLYALFGLPMTAAPIPIEELAAHAHPHDAHSLGRFLRTLLYRLHESSVDFRLIRPDGITRHIRMVAEPVLDDRGILHSVRGACQDISAQHWTEVALAATRDQLADSEAESADRTKLALQLQHAIMPPAPAPLDVPGIRIAVRYRPAESQSLVGGDWYDSVVLPNNRILISVGDVAGHGIQAATGMVILRNALRGLAVTGAGPAQLLSWLNSVAYHLTSSLTATAVCAIYDPRTRRLTWARAGHLPPVLVRGTEARAFPVAPGGLLLGALSEVTYPEEEVQLEHEDTLLMYTDGLVERRDVSVADALTQLLDVASQAASSLEKRLDNLLTYSASDTDDDTCLIGVQVR
ncbi:SpoIIE family protein phosphatase [Streptomyces sp. NPDC059917]|uniref:SpoIIE family protein phosphatase n=1 Tax=Streptomyces sp. NPDC059917 TaxID=3347002 RepID=UPI0036661F10